MSAALSTRNVRDILAYTWRALAATATVPYPREAFLYTVRLVVDSMPVVAAVAFFTAAMLTVQAAASMALIGGGPLSSTVVGFGGVREVFPLMACGAVATRTGAAFAGELGTMRISQQVDAITLNGIDPMRLLVAPRVLAAIIGTPICALAADAIGLWGAFVIGHYQLGFDRGEQWTALTSALAPLDLVVGALKATIFGAIIGIVTTREGLTTTGGPEGVGRATNQAVVRSMVLGACASLLVTWVVYGKLASGGGS